MKDQMQTWIGKHITTTKYIAVMVTVEFFVIMGDFIRN